jgi:hypothetical protein
MDHLPPRSKEGTLKLQQGHRKGRTRPANLREQVDPETMKMYPTPTATERSGINPKTGKGAGLSKMVKMMYPTPRSSGQENPETLIKRKGVKAAAQHNLTAAVKMYPTPKVGCEEGGEQSSRVERTKSGGFILRKKNKPDSTFGAKLSDAMLYLERQMLPTPTVNDSKNNGGISQQKAKERGYGVNLNGVVGGKLNPNFVEFLMGFHMDWTKVELTELKPSATQSSHKSQEN